jgi:hypothetical protein
MVTISGSDGRLTDIMDKAEIEQPVTIYLFYVRTELAYFGMTYLPSGTYVGFKPASNKINLTHISYAYHQTNR